MGKGPTTRRYSDEFKRDAVALYRSSGRPIKEVARELGISDTSLGTWVRESEKNAPAGEFGPRTGICPRPVPPEGLGPVGCLGRSPNRPSHVLGRPQGTRSIRAPFGTP